ncbi:metallophosphoesterase [Chishuiella sp.]|uniref:metallophosphoesterase n=1 Tax=Chishuiella sp. TaxID=1969467 RepID=UPI0028B253AA|nr:metallophosphoesterase [Chishuiella sp.]
MKILPTLNKKINYPFLTFLGISLCMSSCATHHAQFGKNLKQEKVEGKKIQSLYLIGDAGNLYLIENKQNLSILKKELSKADSASYLIFLGDNVYENGIVVDSANSQFKVSREKLQLQIDLAKNFKGKTLFIPGNHDWRSGMKGLNEQESIIKKQLNTKKSFLPKDGCPIDKINVNDSIGIIAIDSEWYLQDWDKHPSINENCDIKSREDFLEELESQLNKYQNRTTILAVHHPLFSNGSHGGQYDLKKQLYPFGEAFKIPLPVIGSFINLLRSSSGLNPQDLSNYKYREFSSRIATLIENRNNVIVVSGHDHNLQYIQHNNIKQIISGAGSKRESAKTVGRNDFSYGDKGYAILDLYDNGASKINYYAFRGNDVELLLSKEVTEKNKVYEEHNYTEKIPNKVEASVYPKKETEKSNTYKFFLGKHYRSTYGQSVSANTANLDELHGGLRALRKGGGHQTRSLRLIDIEGREYNMRSVKKSATQFIQQVAFKDKYVADEFNGTFTEKFLMDFYTTNNPYYPIVAANLMKPLQIMHSTPDLYYVPKQNALGKYNEDFGNELYMIEERPMALFQDDRFGYPKDIVSTDDMLAAINKNKNVVVDKDAYMRARLFDMLVGDWDRHEDQWRWGAYKDGKKTIYQPIPRDRDQVFPRYDGLLLRLLMRIPALRHMQDYGDDIRNVKWFNREPYSLDLAVLESSDLEAWLEQAKYIQNNLSDKFIRESFEMIPDEVKQNYDKTVIDNLIKRKAKLEKFAKEYHKVLRKLIILKGTNKKDEFLITRLPKGETNIKVYSGGKKNLILDETYNKKETKEIRLYGFKGKDHFNVDGSGKNKILVRVIGASDTDKSQIEKLNKIKVYENTLNGYSSDTVADNKKSKYEYEVNTYLYKQPKYNYYSALPNFGFNPDDGLKIGISPTYTVNGFYKEPYSQKHTLQANYFFATQALELKYKGTFIKTIGNWNLDVNAIYTTPTYSTNYFGLGNETKNNQKDLGMNYNRVRLRNYAVGASVFKVTDNNGRIDFFGEYSHKTVQENFDRVVKQPGIGISEKVFKGQNFGEIGAKYLFKNYDNESMPESGMIFLTHAKWVTNLEEVDRNFFFTEMNLGFTHKISANGRLTIASMLKGKAVWGKNENIEFYQMATLGGDQDFRGYRPGRFAANKVFLQTSDLRFDAFRFKAIVPLRLGVFVGADYGRVWLDGENSKKWHSSTGGGIWLNGVNTITATISYFKGDDPGRVVFGFNFGF